MNLVLADTEEFRRVKRKPVKAQSAPGSTAAPVESEEKRTLGLTIVRGTHIISLSVESPPPADPSARLGTSAPGGAPTMQTGPGIARPAGRGLPVGLTGPVGGVGGPPGGFAGFQGGPAGFPGGALPGFPGRGQGFSGVPSNFPGGPRKHSPILSDKSNGRSWRFSTSSGVSSTSRR
jgi:hypothetical protein